MNTIRVTRPPVDVPGRRTELHLLTLLVVALLCAAVFVCCFAIGRAERPKLATGERLPPSVPVASAGASIPLALNSAPPIDVRDIIVVKTPAPPARSTTATKTTVEAARVSSSVAPAVSRTITPAIVTPAPVAPAVTTPVSTGEHSSGGTSTPAASAPPAKQAPAAKSETSSSTSFENSG
jgi:hypothetical protein